MRWRALAYSDETGEPSESHSEESLSFGGDTITESCKGHDADGIDHGEFIG